MFKFWNQTIFQKEPINRNQSKRKRSRGTDKREPIKRNGTHEHGNFANFLFCFTGNFLFCFYGNFLFCFSANFLFCFSMYLVLFFCVFSFVSLCIYDKIKIKSAEKQDLRNKCTWPYDAVVNQHILVYRSPSKTHIYWIYSNFSLNSIKSLSLALRS